eukprot:1150633-Pelagomonas_calceolata.AAC.1
MIHHQGQLRLPYGPLQDDPYLTPTQILASNRNHAFNRTWTHFPMVSNAEASQATNCQRFTLT